MHREILEMVLKGKGKRHKTLGIATQNRVPKGGPSLETYGQWILLESQDIKASTVLPS